MEYKHKSGNIKRKEKRERDEKAKKGQQNLLGLGYFSQVKNKSNLEEEVDNNNKPLVSPSTSQPPTPSNDSNVYSAPPTLNCEESESLISPQLLEKDNDDEVAPSTSTNISLQHEIFDIGNLNILQPSTKEVEAAVSKGPEDHPNIFPADSTGRLFPLSLLKFKLPNNEVVPRDWLVWSNIKQSLFCFPCRLFCTQAELVRSKFASVNGYSKDQKWKKLYERIPEHQSSHCHKECYMKWKDMEINLKKGGTIFHSIQNQLQSEIITWKQILYRLLDVTLFLSERGLPFRGVNQKVGQPNNGNFLGVLELLSHYDPVLSKHLEQVQHSQESNKRMQVHYLSWRTQNEFISSCANHVRKIIVDELKRSKYYSIMVDATPDSSHVEQTSFVFRYIAYKEDVKEYEIHERFLEFSDCNEKTGEEIANLIKRVFKNYDISLDDCRGQGFDNGSNMSGKYKGVQAIILKLNPLAIYSPCGCHSLNLCGVCAAECCTEAQTFFGIVQNLYNLFSCSPKRWEILKEIVGFSLHSLSDTRWSARVECVRPIAAHIGKITEAVSSLLNLNVTVETRSIINGVLEYLHTFKCVVMASIWVKILMPINYRSQLLQMADATLDVEVENIENLIEELNALRKNWDKILSECKLVASAYGIEPDFPTSRRVKKRKTFYDEATTEDTMLNMSPEERFKIEVFYTIIDVLVSNLRSRFTALREIQRKFSFIWKYQEMDESSLTENCVRFVEEYKSDVSTDLIEEIKYLKCISKSNIGETPLVVYSYA